MQNKSRIIPMKRFLEETGDQVLTILKNANFVNRLPEGLIRDRILDYSLRGGKYLRPALMRAAAGAVGGNPDSVLSVAAAVEMFHTWTLVHDDIIDRDERRRGGPTVHAKIRTDFQDWCEKNPTVSQEHLSNSLAILIGDAQQGLVVNLMAEAGCSGKLPPELILHLIAELEGEVLSAVMNGEVLDMLQTGIHLDKISLAEIERMIAEKTGALLTYSVTTGGKIGIRTIDNQHPRIKSLRIYGENLGLAFQLRDDILGILGDQEKLGKPVGSDFREGKRTMAIKIAHENAVGSDRDWIRSHLGKPDLSADDVQRLKDLVVKYGGVKWVEKRAKDAITQSIAALENLPDNPYRYILQTVAEYTVSRQR